MEVRSRQKQRKIEEEFVAFYVSKVKEKKKEFFHGKEMTELRGRGTARWK